jgi:hypothetical protein
MFISIQMVSLIGSELTMALKSLALVALLLAVSIIMVIGNQAPREPQVSDTVFSRQAAPLAERVQEAKQQGKKRLVFPAPIGIPVDIKSLSEAFDNLQVLVVQPISQESCPQGDSDIITWHKFKIIGDLSHANARQTSHRDLEELLPKNIALQDLGNDEVLIPQAGGILNLDGVTLIQETNQFPLLSPHQKYLLFVSKNPSEKIAKMELGPFGVFAIDQDGQLTPLIDRESPIINDIRQFYGSSLARLKAEAK